MSRLYRRNRDLSEPLESVELTVERAEEGRFDAFLTRHLPWRSRSGARLLIEEGAALLNGEARKPSTRVRVGDIVTVDVRRPPRDEPPPPSPDIRVLYEDEHFMALDKEAGVVVHPVGVHQEGTLIQELHRRFREGPLPKLAHRIDQYTSGVLLVARSDAVRARFSDMLELGSVRKIYDALLLGRPEWEECAVDQPIGSVGDSRILMRIDPEDGKSARSLFRVRERLDHACHASVRIDTGRTHQIRVHASHLGHPLLGDHLYGDGIPLHGFERFALHARSLAFPHPVTDEPMRIEAPLPEAFMEALARMRGETGESGP